MHWSFLKFFKYLLICSPILCVAGMVTILAGAGTQHPGVVRIGTGLFLAGIAIFPLAIGGRSLSITLLAAQTCGSKVITERPFYSALWIIFSLVLVLFGIGLLCLVVRGYFLPR